MMMPFSFFYFSYLVLLRYEEYRHVWRSCRCAQTLARAQLPTVGRSLGWKSNPKISPSRGENSHITLPPAPRLTLTPASQQPLDLASTDMVQACRLCGHRKYQARPAAENYSHPNNLVEFYTDINLPREAFSSYRRL